MADRHGPAALVASGSVDRLRPYAKGVERERLDDLASILPDKADLDAQLSLQDCCEAG